MGSGRKRKASAVPQREKAPDDGLVELHRASFVDWRPRPVAALAAAADGSLAAALREDGDVELYDTSTFACIQRIPGSASACATCLAIVEEEEDAQHRSLRPRIFTGGLDGTITELSLESLAPAAAVDSHGGAVWALAPQPGGPVAPGEPRRLAAACDDGSVRLFSVEHGGGGGGGTTTTTFARALPRVEGRVLCLAWHPNGDALACAGSDGCIHVWSASSGRELLRIVAAEGGACVWDVMVLPDGTLASADGSGTVAFWDGAHGTLLARFRQHRADALRLAAAPDGNTVFSAGVDGQVAVYRRLRAGTPAGAAAAAAEQQQRRAQAQRQGQAGAGPAPVPARPAAPWAFLSTKRCHSHDVRALAVVSGRHAPQPRLLSGGNDTQVLAHSVARFLNEHPASIDTAPQRPLLQAARVADSAGCAVDAGRVPWLLSVQRDTLDLWQLGTAAPGSGARGRAVEGGLVNAAVQPLHMARLANKGGRHVLAVALSPDGRYLAYSDVAGVKCLRLSEQLGTDAIPVPHLGLAPVRLPAAAAAPARLLAFRPGGGAQLLAAGMDGTVRLVDLAQAEAAAAGAPRSEGGGGGGEGGVVLLRALHDLRYKPHARRDRGRSAARWALPPLELMAPSPDGRWLAAVARGRVHLLSLASGRLTQLPPVAPEGQLPVSVLRFLPGGARLLVATSALQGGGGAAHQHQLALYDVQAGAHSEWSLALQQGGGGGGGGGGAAGAQPGLPPRLRRMPGALVHASPRPGAPSAALLQSSAAVCPLDLSRPLSQEQRGGGGGGGGRKQRRAHRPAPLNGPPGENGRLLHGDKVLLFAEYIGPRALLLVERTWEEAWADVPAPLQRHRFGS